MDHFRMVKILKMCQFRLSSAILQPLIYRQDVKVNLRKCSPVEGTQQEPGERKQCRWIAGVLMIISFFHFSIKVLLVLQNASQSKLAECGFCHAFIRMNGGKKSRTKSPRICHFINTIILAYFNMRQRTCLVTTLEKLFLNLTLYL